MPETREAVISTGAPVRRSGPDPTGRFGPWFEQLDVNGADLSRMVGAPVLLDHRARTDAQIGVVEAAHVEGGKIVAKLRFGESRLAREIAKDVAAKIRRQLSLGYEVHEWRKVPSKADVPTFAATSWQPLEASIVAIGADGGATFRNSTPETMRFMSMDAELTSETPEVPAPKTRTVDDDEIVSPANGAAKERRRALGIFDAASRLGVDLAVAQDLVARGVDLATAREALFEHKARQQQAYIGTGVIRGGVDHNAPDELIKRMVPALAHRLFGMVEVPEASREFVSASILDMTRILAETRGQRVRSTSELAASLFTRDIGPGLHSTSDFAALVSGGSERALLERFRRNTPELTAVARRSLVPDFRVQTRLRIGEGGALAEVNEGGEIVRGTTSTQGETYVVRSFAKIYAFARKLVVNDDLGALQDFIAGAADAASGTLGDVLASVVTTNAALSDGVALFHSTHGNLAASGTAIDVTNVGLARKAMRSQLGVDGTPITVRPTFLVVGPAQETAAEQLLASLSPTAVSAVNPFSGALKLIIEPRLSGNQWYLFAEPSMTPVLEYGELDASRRMGGGGPVVDTRMGWDIQGLELRIQYDVGAGAVDWRGAFKNPGI